LGAYVEAGMGVEIVGVGLLELPASCPIQPYKQIGGGVGKTLFKLEAKRFSNAGWQVVM
jgi:hypothetical protein